MPPKKKTTTTEAEEPVQEPTLAVAPATEPPQDDKHEDKQAQAEGKVGNASSPLSAFGKKKNKSQTKPKEHDNKVYVIFNSDMDQPDAIYEEKKEGSKEAVFMITGGDDEIPFVAYEGAGVIRVFRSFKALKAYYIKGLAPRYSKFAVINPTPEKDTQKK
eukprot:g14862.t1